LEEIHNFYQRVHTHEMKLLGKTQSTALIIAQIIENFYTCIETLFLRISQFFENSIASEKWHKDLLDKMTLHIEGIREAVISEGTYKNLLEIMRFRHFKRYYFELDYDWEKLDFISAKFEKAYSSLKKDLQKFINFLERLES
ncbi:MAG: hypothetical protein D6748_16120, partial [Calditrichaeota bacterium]